MTEEDLQAQKYRKGIGCEVRALEAHRFEYQLKTHCLANVQTCVLAQKIQT